MSDPKYKYVNYDLATDKINFTNTGLLGRFKNSGVLTMDEAEFAAGENTAYKQLRKRVSAICDMNENILKGGSLAPNMPNIKDLNQQYADLEASTHTALLNEHLSRTTLGTKKPLNQKFDERMKFIKSNLQDISPSEDPDGYKKFWEETRAGMENDIKSDVENLSNELKSKTPSVTLTDPEKDALIKQLLADADREFYQMHQARLVAEKNDIAEDLEFEGKLLNQTQSYNHGILRTGIKDTLSRYGICGHSHEKRLAKDGAQVLHKAFRNKAGAKCTFELDASGNPGAIHVKGSSEEQTKGATAGVWQNKMSHVDLGGNFQIDMGNLKAAIQTGMNLLALCGEEWDSEGKPTRRQPGVESSNEFANAILKIAAGQTLSQKEQDNLSRPSSEGELKIIESMLKSNLDLFAEEKPAIYTQWKNTMASSNTQLERITAMTQTLQNLQDRVIQKVIDNYEVHAKDTSANKGGRPEVLTAGEKKFLEKGGLTEQGVINGHKDKVENKKAAEAKATSQLSPAQKVHTNSIAPAPR